MTRNSSFSIALRELELQSVGADGVKAIRVCIAADDMLSILQKILAAHDSRNDGSCNGQAVLCGQFADLARDAIKKATGSQHENRITDAEDQADGLMAARLDDGQLDSDMEGCSS